MDATRFSSKKLAIFLTLALLLAAAPWAQGQTLVAQSSISVSSLVGQGTQLSVTSSDGSLITFSAAVTYPNGGPQWLSVNNSCATVTGLTTPATLTLAHGCGGSGAGIQPATITLTPTSPAGNAITVTATLGSALGTITATGNPGGSGALNLSAAAGASTTGTVTLSTSSSSPIGFTISTTGATWLSVTQTGGTTNQVFAGSNATLTVTANASGLTSSPSPATINVNYNGTNTPILVTFNVGGTGSGSLSLSQNTVNWSFNTGGTALQQNISVNTPAPTYSASITSITPSNVYWLQLTSNVGNTGTVVNGSGNTSLTLSSNSNILTLTTGSYQATVQVTDSNLNNAFITVNLSVNGGTSGLTVSPNPVTVSAAPGATGATLVSVTSTTGGTMTVSIAGTGLTTSLSGSTTVVAGTPSQFYVYGNSTGLSQTTYTGTLTVTVGAATQNVPVSFTVGSGGTNTTGSSVAPGTITFNYQTDGNQGNPQAQQLMIGGSQTFTATVTQNNTSGAIQWLSVTPGSGTAPAQIFVSVSPNGLPAGSYSGTVNIAFNGGTSLSSTVNLTVTTGTPQIFAQPGTWVLNQPSGTPSTSIYLYSTNGTAIPVTVSTSTSWLSFLSALPTTTQSSFAVQANTSGLTNGINQGSITVSTGTGTLTIPVVVYLTNGTGTNNGNLTFTPSSVTLNSQVGSVAAATTTLYVTTSGSTTLFSSTASETTCTQANWLSINVTQAYVYNGFSQPITVSATAAGLPAGSCTGAIQLSSNGVTQSVPVTFTIGGGISLSTSSLSFQFTSGGTTPAAQTFTVTNSAGAAIHYSVSATTSTGGNWLSATPASGTTGTTGPISVSVNPSGMAAGTYNGTVSVTPDGGTASNVGVSFTITTPVLSVSPTSLTFAYQAGGATPAAQSVTVSGGGFTASASSTGNWLTVTPTSSATATNLSVSVSPSSLAAGTYNGTISVAGAGGTTGNATISVTLTVTAPLPNITAVVNAASFASGALSPGEVISIGGTGLGPANAAFLTLDSNGNVATTIGGVSVTIGGFAAPLIYASSTQINAVVPYEVAGQISFSIVVKYLGQSSNGFTVQGTVAAPGIFTQNASGSGPGAILNQDYSLNGSSHPAARGSVVQVFMTGEGKTTPTAQTGKVNNVTNASQLPVPLLPVTASVGGQPAQVTFAAEAPGTVSGVMQVNLLIPEAAASGAQQILINVGTTPSQTGVTVTVQ